MLERQWIETIRRDSSNRDLGPHSPQGPSNATTPSTNIMMIHCLTEHHVGIRVKASGELLNVVLQIGLNGVATTLEWVFLALGTSPKPGLALKGGPLAELADPAGDAESIDRPAAVLVVVATEVCRVGANG